MTDERENASETQGVKKVFGRRADVLPIEPESEATSAEEDAFHRAAEAVPVPPGPRRQVFGGLRARVGMQENAELVVTATSQDGNGGAVPSAPMPFANASAPWPSMSPVLDPTAETVAEPASEKAPGQVAETVGETVVEKAPGTVAETVAEPASETADETATERSPETVDTGLATTPAMQPGEWEALQEMPVVEAVVEMPQELLESPTMKLVEDFRERVMAILGPDHQDRWTVDDEDFAHGADGLPRPVVSPLDEDITEDLMHLLESKVEEFHALGYGEVTTDDIWQYMRGLRKNRPTSLHALVNGILCLQPQAFMNFAMRKMYEHASRSTLSDLF